jgi:hypothetical protein
MEEYGKILTAIAAFFVLIVLGKITVLTKEKITFL